MTTRPADKDYVPRKGDKLLLEVTVKYDHHADGNDATIYAEHRFTTVSVKRSEIYGITHLQLEPGDYVVMEKTLRIGKVEHIIESYAMVSFAGIYPPVSVHLSTITRAPPSTQEKDTGRAHAA